PDAKIISQAVVSNTPAFPKKIPIVAVATLITLVLSAGLVTTSELLRATAARPSSIREPVELAHVEPTFGGAAPPLAQSASAERLPQALYSEVPASIVSEARSHQAKPAASAENFAPHPALGVALGAVHDVAKRLRENVAAGHGVALFGATGDVPTALP